MKNTFTSIDQYISLQPKEHQATLEKVRQTILSAAPGAQEVISYQMPAFKLNGVLVYFAIYKNHLGFYPTASGILAFKDEFADYKWSKGAVQFPLDKAIPYTLIKKIVKFRVEETKAKTQSVKKADAKKKPVSKTKVTDVDQFLKATDHPLKELMQETRNLILKTDRSIGEEISWNAPSFFYTGEMKPFKPKEYKRSIVVFNIFKKDELRLICLRGAFVDDPTKILEGDYKDGRRLITLQSLSELKQKKTAIQKVIKSILALINSEN